MDVYQTNLNQDQLNTQEFWANLHADEESENIFAVTEAQITKAANAEILTQERADELKSRKEAMTASIKLESLKRYPVQVPEKSAQQTYSDKYKSKMSDSKRERKQNLLGTDLHRKKLNAEDVEHAESKYHNEKSSQLAKFLNMVQTSYPALLRGKSVDDLISDPDISDRAEFLVYDDEHLFENLNILFGEKFEADLGQECVRQFMELDLSADLRTDKKLAKDADRLEKVTTKARAMINLADNHPEIKESLSPKEREEFEKKLDRAYAFIDYYEMRKSIITDEVYRTHENSELSMRFEPMPAHLAQQMNLLEIVREQEGQFGEELLNEQLVQAEKRAEKYYKEQNLIRKIWDADQRASTMSKYTERKVSNRGYHMDLYQSLMEETEQKDAPEDAAAWETYVRSMLTDKNRKNLSDGKPLPPPDPESHKVKYLNDHKKADDPVFEAVTKASNIAGTRDKVDELSREYGLKNWAGLNILSDKEFETMLENLTAFNVRQADEKWFSPSDLEQLRKMELNALRSYKKILGGEVEFLKQKYGCGLRLENPFSVAEHRSELVRDMGNGQTITDMFTIFRKYGIMDTNDPADLEMEATIWYLYTHQTAAAVPVSLESSKVVSGTLTSYSDMMRKYILEFGRQLNALNIDTAVKIRITELERELDGNHMVKWGLKPSYAPAPDENES